MEIKPGRWRERGGGIAIVEERCHSALGYQWFGRDSLNWPSLWDGNGLWLRSRLHQHDIIEYLEPLKENNDELEVDRTPVE